MSAVSEVRSKIRDVDGRQLSKPKIRKMKKIYLEKMLELL